MRNLDLIEYAINKVVEKYDLKRDRACPEARVWKLGNCGLSIYMAESLPEGESFWYNSEKDIVATTIMSGTGDEDEGILIEKKDYEWDEKSQEWEYKFDKVEFVRFTDFEEQFGEKYLY